MKRISQLLVKNQNKKFNFKKNNEYFFYKKNVRLLKELNIFNYLLKVNNSFDMICANSVIYSYLNKLKLDDICKDLFSSIFLNNKLSSDEFIKYYHSRIVDLRYFNSNGIKIYIPFFSHSINDLYINEPIKLLEMPYSELLTNFKNNIIDPFDTYDINLFDSNFTKLVEIKKYDNFTALYDFDLATIFLVNSQGRLEYQINIFDKWMKNFNTSHVLDRIIPAIDAYYSGDKQAFVNQLFENGLISERMFKLISNE